MTSHLIKDNKEKVFIVSNFANLSTHAKALLYQKCKYIIYEHVSILFTFAVLPEKASLCLKNRTRKG